MKKIIFIVMVALMNYAVIAEKTNKVISNYVDTEFASSYIKDKKSLGRVQVLLDNQIKLEKDNEKLKNIKIKASMEAEGETIYFEGSPTFNQIDNSFIVDWVQVKLNNEKQESNQEIEFELKSFFKTTNDEIPEKENIWVIGETNDLVSYLNELKQRQSSSSNEITKDQKSEEIEPKSKSSSVAAAAQEDQNQQQQPALNVEVEENLEEGIVTYKRMCTPRFNLKARMGYDRLAKLDIPIAQIDQRKDEILTFTNSQDETMCKDGTSEDGLAPFELTAVIGSPCMINNANLIDKTIDRGFRLTFNNGFSAVTSENSYDSQGLCFYKDNQYAVQSNDSSQFYNLKTQVSGDCPVKEDMINSRIDRGYQYIIDPTQNPTGAINPSDQNTLSKCNYKDFEGAKTTDDFNNERYYQIIKEYPGDEGSNSTCPVSIDTEKQLAIETFDVVYYDHEGTRKIINSCILGEILSD